MLGVEGRGGAGRGGGGLCPQAAPGNESHGLWGRPRGKPVRSYKAEHSVESYRIKRRTEGTQMKTRGRSSGQRCQCESEPGKDLDWLEEGEEGRAQAVPSGNLSEQGRRREKTEPSLENLRLFIHSSVQQMLTTCQALC